MQQFIVPQFIDVEDKIIGPVTIRQFIILLVGMFFMFLAYQLFDFGLFLLSFLVILCLEIVLAFVRVNGQPFHFFIINFLQTVRQPSLQIWYKKSEKHKVDNRPIKKRKKGTMKPPAGGRREMPKSSRLSELALLVDTGGAYQPEEEKENKAS